MTAPFFGVVAGGASHAPTLGGALYGLASKRPLAGAAGVSAGAICAAAAAFGLRAEVVRELFVDALQDNRLLDKNAAGVLLHGWGICHWNELRERVRAVFGDAVMGDAAIPLVIVVSDAYFRRPRYLSKRDTPKVSLVDAITVSTSIWPLAPMREMPSWSEVVGNRLFFDGGWCDNFPTHVFDERPEQTVGFRLGGEPPTANRLDSLVDAAKAALECALFAGQLDKSKKPDTVIVDVDTSRLGSGFDFSLTPTQTRARWVAGEAAALRA